MGNVAVIGAGPAGLSLAQLLSEAGVEDVVVYEAADRVGGKSLTAAHGGGAHEMGTCYSTLAHYLTNLWMWRLGMRQRRLGAQAMDGRPYLDWVRSGPGESLLRQGPRFIRLWSDFQRRQRAAAADPEALAEAAMPIGEWLERHQLHRARRFMLRAVTNLGYGFLDEVATVQALRWCTPALLVSGLINEVRMPVAGWQTFWERLAQGLDVRLNAPAQGIERAAEGVTVVTPQGTERFKALAVAIPPDEFARLTPVSPEEAQIAASIEWGRYATTLCEVENWFARHEIESFSAALESSAPAGSVLSARLSPGDGSSGGRLYVTGQYAADLPAAMLEGALERCVDGHGARFRGVVLRSVWKYFPRYRLEAIRDGLLDLMTTVQGRSRTWWTGAAFSHEAVSNIVEHNVALARHIRRSLSP
jgi:hypothetical protein